MAIAVKRSPGRQCAVGVSNAGELVRRSSGIEFSEPGTTGTARREVELGRRRVGLGCAELDSEEVEAFAGTLVVVRHGIQPDQVRPRGAHRLHAADEVAIYVSGIDDVVERIVERDAGRLRRRRAVRQAALLADEIELQLVIALAPALFVQADRVGREDVRRRAVVEADAFLRVAFRSRCRRYGIDGAIDVEGGRGVRGDAVQRDHVAARHLQPLGHSDAIATPMKGEPRCRPLGRANRAYTAARR